MAFAELLELLVSVGIFTVALGLSGLSYLAWQREHDRQMRIVTGGYALFALYGLAVLLQHLLKPYFPYELLDLVEYGAGLFILGGLLMFFFAIKRD